MSFRFQLLTLGILLVFIVALIVSVTPVRAAACNVPGDYATIDAAMAVPSCTIINVAGGVHAGTTISRAVTIIGAGRGVTSISQAGGNSVLLDAGAGNVVLKDMSLTGSQYGIRIDTSTPIDGITLDNVAVDNNTHTGFFLNDGTTVSNVVINNSSFSNNTYLGVYLLHDASLSGFYVTNTAFDGNHDGLYVRNWWTAGSRTDDVFDNITILNSTFNNNEHKGMYFEKLSNALFDGITVDHSGYIGLSWDAGVDINLKYGSYSNIEFRNSTITNSGTGDPVNGVGITIKQRNDPSSYNTYPAILSNVRLSCVTIVGNQTGIRFGEPGKVTTTPNNVVMEYSTLANNIDEDAENTGTTFVTATLNWWGSINGPTAGKLVGNIEYDPWLTSEPACPLSSDAAGEAPRCKTSFNFGTVDPAPIDGQLRFYINFGENFRPEGNMIGDFPVVAGQRVEGVVKEVFCGSYVRAWLFDEKNYVVGMVPSQYYSGDKFEWGIHDYGLGGPQYGYWSASNNTLYAATFANMIVLSKDSPDAIIPNLSDGHVVPSDLGDGLTEWGRWRPQDGVYLRLGWTKLEENGSITCAVVDEDMYTLEEFSKIMAANGLICTP